MFFSLSTLSSSASTSSNSTNSATTEILSTVQSQSFEEKISLTSKEEVERKLASILTQIQQNQVKHLNLTSVSMGQFYDLAHTLRGHKSAVCSLAVLKNGFLASGLGNPENTIKLWDLASHSCLSTLRGHTDQVIDLIALPNGLLASGSSDYTIKLWDLASNSCLSTLHGHTSAVWALAVLPNGLLASGSRDNTIKIWDLTSHSCLSTLQGHTWGVWALAALPSGLLASGSNDNTIKLWDLASHSCLFILRSHTDYVGTLVTLPNGLLASGSRDDTIKLWDLASNSCLSTLQEHTEPVYALAALSNGLLASGSRDKTIKLWDLASKSCLSTLHGHTSAVWALAALPNGLLASGSNDETIKLWRPKTLSAQYLKPVLKALGRNTSVTYLDLSGNQNIFDDLIDPLIEIFKKNRGFPFFNFRSKPNTSLKTIDLRRTGVSQKGVKKLQKAIQHQRLSIEVLSDCPVEWMMIYFLIVFCRANRSNPFADSGLDLCKHGELGPFLGIPSRFFARPHKSSSSANSKHVAPSPR